MSADIDLPPLYDPFVKTQNNKGYMSDQYRDWLAGFVQTLISYVNSGGIFLPHLTTTQRDELDSPQNGQMIYNTTLETAQYFRTVAGVGAWVSF